MMTPANLFTGKKFGKLISYFTAPTRCIIFFSSFLQACISDFSSYEMQKAETQNFKPFLSSISILLLCVVFILGIRVWCYIV